jgi:trigger factor
MQTSLESLGALERRLSISVPRDEIEAEIETRLKKLTRTAKLRGFRPGKVPYKVVAQQYGPQVRQEVLGDTVQKTFSDAVKEQNLRVAGLPRIEPKPVEQDVSLFEYSATFEVYPEIKVGDLGVQTIERPTLELGEAEIDKTIEIMRKQRVHYHDVDRGAVDGDQVTIDFKGTIADEEFAGGNGKDHSFVLGQGRMLKGFENQLLGMRAGEAKTFELRFPEDYHGREVAGKTATFEVTVQRVGAPHVPEVDVEFAKRLGVANGDLAKMREEVGANVAREVKRRINSRVKERVMQALIDTTAVELPNALVHAEAARLHRQASQDMEARGVKGTLPPEFFAKQAERRVHLGLILAELVNVHDLKPKPAQVREIVQEYAQSYEHPDEVIKWYYSAPDRLSEAEALALEDNVVAWVLTQAKVVDKPIAFDELMGNA